ncbi:MAG: glycosyltransferase [Pseudobdellovibrionaceae bacterium]
MKLTYVSGSTIPSDKANAVHVMKMCQALARDKQVDVRLLAKKGKGKIDPYAYYGVKNTFKLSRSPFGTGRFSGFWRLVSLIVHVGLIPSEQVLYGRDALGLLMLSYAGIPVFFEAHQIPQKAIEKKIWTKLFASKNFKGLIVISHGLEADIHKAFPDYKGPVLVAHDGADLTERAPKGVPAKDWPGRSKAIQIGYTGSLHEGRGMEIIAKLAPLLPEMDFHVIGGTPEQIEAWKEKKVPANIHFHGQQPHAKIPAYLTWFDIVLAPYQENIKIKTGADISRWISPMKLFEYMAAGKAIICSDLPALREILEQGRTGTFVPPSDIHAWMDAVTYLAKSAPLRQAMGFEGERDIHDRFSWSIRAKSVLNFIRTQTGAH